MGYSSTLLRLSLIALAITAPIAMHRLADKNGLFEYRPFFNNAKAVLPGTNVLVKVPRTGIKEIDDYLSFMVSLFWVDLDSRNVKAHVQGTHFYGTLSSIWILMLVEAHRAGHKPWFLYATYVMETLGELAGLGCFTPLWCLVQLAAVPLLAPKKQRRTDELLYLREGDATPLAIAILIGFIGPSAMMFASQPGHATLYSTQTWVLLRLIHPVFVFAVWAVLAPRRTPSSTASLKAGSVSWAKARTLQHFYTAAILLSAVAHLLSVAPLVQMVMEPGWLNADVVRQLQPRDLLSVSAFWLLEPPKISNFAEGVSIFLQWDEIMAATSVVVWAFGTFVQGRAEVSSKPGLLKTVLQMVGVGAVAGPGAVAAFLLQERDGLIFEAASQSVQVPSLK